MNVELIPVRICCCPSLTTQLSANEVYVVLHMLIPAHVCWCMVDLMFPDRKQS